jgi:dolichol-phosphate mannosyltransferase
MRNGEMVSIVIPVYNEQGNIDPLLKQLIPVVKKYKYEIIFVDDGSTDGTVGEIIAHTKSNTVKLISFRRNFGHQMALDAGYKKSRGSCVISMDADLQDPPEIIPQMIEKWDAGALVVYAKRIKRNVDTPFKRLTARTYYGLVNVLSDTPIPKDVGDYRLLDRKVVDFINDLPEQSRFLRGLVAWGNFPSATVTFDRARRNRGETHYTIGKMINFALDGMTSFSTKPLQISSYLGFGTASIGFLGIIYAILGRLFLPEYWITGWTALFVGIMFLGGVQLITIGIIGEYIGKIYKEVQKRPRYVIKQTVNLD